MDSPEDLRNRAIGIAGRLQPACVDEMFRHFSEVNWEISRVESSKCPLEDLCDLKNAVLDTVRSLSYRPEKYVGANSVIQQIEGFRFLTPTRAGYSLEREGVERWVAYLLANLQRLIDRMNLACELAAAPARPSGANGKWSKRPLSLLRNPEYLRKFSAVKVTEAADAWGVTPRTISEKLRAGKLTRAGKNRVKVDECFLAGIAAYFPTDESGA